MWAIANCLSRRLTNYFFTTMMPPVTFLTLIAKFGDSNIAIARALGVDRQLVAYWRVKGISESRQSWIREKIAKRRRSK